MLRLICSSRRPRIALPDLLSSVHARSTQLVDAGGREVEPWAMAMQQLSPLMSLGYAYMGATTRVVAAPSSLLTANMLLPAG